MYQRQKKILDMLQRGKVSIPSAAAELGVTEMTVRRDLKELEKRKLALLVKGGAIPFPARYEPEENELEHLERKNAIADVLFLRILPADSIFLSAGSTTLAFARVLARRNTRPMTVITNSLSIASTLFRSSCKVILLGGELRTHSLDLIGPVAEKNLEEYHVDYLISGCDAAIADHGFYTSDMSLANLERKSLRIADQAVIVCDSSKFGKRALTRFAQTNEIDLLVTDDNLRHEDFTLLHRSGMEILKASVSGSTPSGITP